MDLRNGLAVLFALSALDATAATRIVTDTGDAGDGTCDATCTLRDAVDASQEDDRILFDAGFKSPVELLLTGGALQIDVPLRITATDGVRTTLRRSSGIGRLIETSGSADARIIGLAFEDGGGGGVTNGGAILVAAGTTMELRDCLFRNNRADGVTTGPVTPPVVAHGGAIDALGALLVEGCSFVGNRAIGVTGFPFGGAGGGAVGGAIHAAGALTVLNSTFSANIAQGGTGALGMFATIPNFPGGPGGAGGHALGGAIATSASASATTAFSTIIDNQAIAGSGGMGGPGMPNGTNGANGSASASAIVSDAPAILDTSIVARNTGGSACSGAALTARSSNRVDDASCPGTVVAALADQFAAIDNSATSPHYPPIEGSVIVDAAPDCLDALGAEVVDLDQLLTPRPLSGNGVNNACDFGAIELNPVLFADGFEEPLPGP